MGNSGSTNDDAAARLAQLEARIEALEARLRGADDVSDGAESQALLRWLSAHTSFDQDGASATLRISHGDATLMLHFGPISSAETSSGREAPVGVELSLLSARSPEDGRLVALRASEDEAAIEVRARRATPRAEGDDLTFADDSSHVTMKAKHSSARLDARMRRWRDGGPRDDQHIHLVAEERDYETLYAFGAGPQPPHETPALRFERMFDSHEVPRKWSKKSRPGRIGPIPYPI